MEHRRWIVRAALVCGAATAGIALWSAADDHAAYAADRPATVEHPGGVLDRPAHHLPEQAAARAKQVTAKVVPSRKPKCDRPETPLPQRPAKKSHPRPTPAAPEPPESAPEHIGQVVDDVATAGGDAAEQLPDPKPTTDPVAPLPATDPEPLPDIEDTLPALLKPTTSPPAAPPVAIGPVPGIAATEPVDEHLPHGVVTDLLAQLVGCDDAPDRLRPDDLGRVQALPASDPDCPRGPHRDITLDGLGAAATGCRCQLAGDLIAPPLTNHGRPALQLLRVLWPRSDIPPSRTEHPEPGPA